MAKTYRGEYMLKYARIPKKSMFIIKDCPDTTYREAKHYRVYTACLLGAGSACCINCLYLLCINYRDQCEVEEIDECIYVRDLGSKQKCLSDPGMAYTSMIMVLRRKRQEGIWGL